MTRTTQTPSATSRPPSTTSSHPYTARCCDVRKHHQHNRTSLLQQLRDEIHPAAHAPAPAAAQRHTHRVGPLDLVTEIASGAISAYDAALTYSGPRSSTRPIGGRAGRNGGTTAAIDWLIRPTQALARTRSRAPGPTSPHHHRRTVPGLHVRMPLRVDHGEEVQTDVLVAVLTHARFEVRVPVVPCALATGSARGPATRHRQPDRHRYRIQAAPEEDTECPA